MENPMSRPRAVAVIAQAVTQHREALEKQICGVSLEMNIYNALNQGGFLKEKPAKNKRKKK